MQTKLVLLLAASLTAACSAPLRNPENQGDAAAVSAVDASPECSSLRADIASSRYKQRNTPPTSTAPIIADAAEAKADLKIDELQQRYDSLGCARKPPADSAAGKP